MTTYEKRLLATIGSSWVEATPGLVLQVFVSGKKRADLQIGKVYDYYDWASLTKIIFTVTATMLAVDRKVLSLNSRVSDFIEWFSDPSLKEIRIKNVLSHSAGLNWWSPFYQSLNLKESRLQRWRILESLLKNLVLDEARSGEKSDKSVYSDLDFFVIGLVLEKIYEKGFNEMFDEINDGFGAKTLSKTHFHVDNKPVYRRTLYAPTENCEIRGRVLQGEVHDENTWALGGVAPHAGLFGPIEDLSRWGLLLRAALRGKKMRGFATPETVLKFARRAIPKARGDWAHGFMLPTYGSASAGKYFSPQSIGHTGFTGTSLWYDPKRDLLVTVLSNRVHPTRLNQGFVKLRPQLHNWVVESL